jgi:peptidylprolyl isomerase
MKFLVLIAGSCLVLSLPACGGGSGETTASSSERVSAAWQQVGPEVPIPHGPPPRKLIVRVLKEGDGSVVKKGDLAKARYINVDYRTARVYEDNWDPPEPTEFNFGYGETLAAWETGMKGMRVGGRRELIVPASQSYGKVPQIYVIELMAATG